MTVTHRMLLACALVLGLILLLVDAIPVASHAELVSSSPAAGATVTGTPDEIVAVFDEPLQANSSMELFAPSGARVATGTVDPADRAQLVIDPAGLAPDELRCAGPPPRPTGTSNAGPGRSR